MVPFVPQAGSEAVKKLKAKLGLSAAPMRVHTVARPGAQERNCFEIVDDCIRESGGRMRLGWAVWQHGDIFIEGEFHSVYDPGEGREWIDVTPRSAGFKFSEILFIPDPAATYDLTTTDVIDNCRVPLLPDPRIQRALDCFTEATKIMNGVSGVNVAMPLDVILKIQDCKQEASKLLQQVERSRQPKPSPKIGRNDPCPCGSGQKYKKCHGA